MRKQQSPEIPPIYTGALSDHESEEPNPMMVMDLLVDINARLATRDWCLDDLTIEKKAQEEQRLFQPMLTLAPA